MKHQSPPSEPIRAEPPSEPGALSRSDQGRLGSAPRARACARACLLPELVHTETSRRSGTKRRRQLRRFGVPVAASAGDDGAVPAAALCRRRRIFGSAAAEGAVTRCRRRSIHWLGSLARHFHSSSGSISSRIPCGRGNNSARLTSGRRHAVGREGGRVGSTTSHGASTRARVRARDAAPTRARRERCGSKKDGGRSRTHRPRAR